MMQFLVFAAGCIIGCMIGCIVSAWIDRALMRHDERVAMRRIDHEFRDAPVLLREQGG